MKSNERKYLLKSENSYPDIGNFVHWHIMQQQVKKKEVASSLGVIGTTVNGYFKNRSFANRHRVENQRGYWLQFARRSGAKTGNSF